MPVIKDYLVKLGVLDSFTDKLESLLGNATTKISASAGKWGKSFVLAGGAVTTAVAVANVGIAKFLTKLVDADDQLTQFARSTWQSKENAWKTKSALDAMGKSMEEIRMNPRLFRQFIELRQNAEKLKPPDMSEGLNQVRGVITEFNKLKQLGGAAIQWVGFYLLKYIEKPIQQVKDALGGVNDKLAKTLPVWSEKIGQALSWIVRLGGTLIRGAGLVFKAIQRVFDMIPGNVKIAIAAFGVLAAFIKMGPIGKLIAVLTAALVLLEDFFTFLDGGDSLLGPVWKTLIGIFDSFTRGGGTALSFFSDEFLPGLISAIEKIFPKLVDKAVSFVDPILNAGVEVIDGLIDLVAENLPKLLGLLGSMATKLAAALLEKAPVLLEAGAHLLTSLINGIITMLPGLIETAINLLDGLVREIMDNLPMILQAGVELLMALVDGFVQSLPMIIQAIFKLRETIQNTLTNNLPKLVQAGIDMLLSLGRGVIDALPEFVKTVVQIIPQFIHSISSNLPEIVHSGITILISLVEGIIEAIPELIAAIPQIITAILEGLSTLPVALMDLGKSLVKSLWTGITKMGTWLKDKVKGFFKNIWNNVKEAFGSGEPDDGSEPGPTTSGGGGGHAQGGIFTREHTARFAEGNQPEAVVPLTKPARAREVLGGIAKFFGATNPDRSTHQVMAGMQSFLKRADAMLSQMGAAMKAGAAVSAANNTNTNTVQNNQKYDMQSTFNIYGSSDPQSTAQAVDRQNQLRIRNMQGVIV